MRYKTCPVCDGDRETDPMLDNGERVPCWWCWDEALARSLGVEIDYDDQMEKMNGLE